MDKSAKKPPEIIKIEAMVIRIGHEHLGSVEIITKAGSTMKIMDPREISSGVQVLIEDTTDNTMEVSTQEAKVCSQMEIFKEIRGCKPSMGMVEEQIQERRVLDQTGI